MDPLYENLARLVGKALAEKWMAVIARRRMQQQGKRLPANQAANPTQRRRRRNRHTTSKPFAECESLPQK